MNLKEIGQTLTGVLILRPDQLLFTGAVNNSYLFGGLVHSNVLSPQTITVLSLGHTLMLVLGIGLLLGVGLQACAAIAFFVAIGAGAGLFEAGQLLNVFGNQIAFITHPLGGMGDFLVGQPFLSDVFIFAPLLVLLGGVLVFRRKKKSRKQKAIDAMAAHLRQYCLSCGVHVGAGASECKACGAPFEDEEDNYCTDCGRGIPAAATFCPFCGTELLKGRDWICPACEHSVAMRATYCYNCGSRMRTARVQMH